MTTLLRPHSGVKCPKIPAELLAEGYIISVETCEGCDEKEDIRRPWHGYIVRCKLEGKPDNRTPEYGSSER